MSTNAVSDAAVLTLIEAINRGDRDAFFAVLSEDATLSDDGTERDLVTWVDREIFDSNGHLDVETATDESRSLVARYRNDTYGTMRTTWRFDVRDGKVTRIEAGQA